MKREWKHLTRKPGSTYQQLFVKDRWIRATTLHDETVGDEPMTPAEVAANYNVPLEVVLEAIEYVRSDPPEIREDWEDEERSLAELRKDPQHVHGPEDWEQRRKASAQS